MISPDFAVGRVLLFDKPYQWTSFDLVNSVRYTLRNFTGIKKIKVGHAGTLDPLATGLLIVCTGRMTRSIEEFQALEKEYTGTFVLGATTPTYDLESEPGNFRDTSFLNEQDLIRASTQFTGDILQTPPLFSAIKIEGKRAYEYAREKEEITIAAKPVFIRSFEITSWDGSKADFRVVCSKGTYIRSLARDFGDILGCGAYLGSLRRTRIGDFSVENALQIEAFKAEFSGR